jgi:hypothetical protein
MALTHKIINQYADVTYDFTTGDLMISDSGWRIQGLKDNKVIETMTLFGEASNAADVIDAVNMLNELGRMAREWHSEPQNPDSVWVHLYGENENPKRALVYDITVVSMPSGMSNPTLAVGAGLYTFSITRSATWEDASVQTLAAQTLNALGGSVALAAIAGDEDARFERFTAFGDSSGATMANGMTKMWWGMVNLHPAISVGGSYSPLQEVEDAYINPSCSPLPTVQSDSSASGSSKIQWLTSATFQNICGEELSGWFTNFPAGYYGRYLILLRCKLSAAETVRLQIRYGQLGGEVSLGDRYINNTAYQFIEMGEASFRPGSLRAAAYDFGSGRNSAGLYIWGQHMTSQVTLSLDCLVMIPLMAHGFADDAYVGYLGSSWVFGTNFYQFEDDERAAVNYSKTGATLATLFGSVQHNSETWRYLRRGGMLVVAGERAAGQDKADTLKVEATYYRRYRTHAPSV